MFDTTELPHFWYGILSTSYLCSAVWKENNKPFRKWACGGVFLPSHKARQRNVAVWSRWIYLFLYNISYNMYYIYICCIKYYMVEGGTVVYSIGCEMCHVSVPLCVHFSPFWINSQYSAVCSSGLWVSGHWRGRKGRTCPSQIQTSPCTNVTLIWYARGASAYYTCQIIVLVPFCVFKRHDRVEKRMFEEKKKKERRKTTTTKILSAKLAGRRPCYAQCYQISMWIVCCFFLLLVLLVLESDRKRQKALLLWNLWQTFFFILALALWLNIFNFPNEFA